MLVLASTSPYRRALLERLCVPFEVASPDVAETPLADETPGGTALRLAQLKCLAIAARRPDDIVIGSDQVADLEGQPIGKPGGREAALAQLMSMRGRTAVFHTAVAVSQHAEIAQVTSIPTHVTFRDFSLAQAQRYLDRDTPYDCAGSAKIESLGIALVARVESTDPTALIGLPLITVVAMLEQLGIAIP